VRGAPLNVVVLVLCAACAPPYAPPCRVVDTLDLGEAPGALVPRPGGEVASVTESPSLLPDAGGATVRVEVFDVEGTRVRAFVLGVPVAASLFGLFATGQVVDLRDGVAALGSTFVERPAPDGGVVRERHGYLAFRFTDGGGVDLPLDDGGLPSAVPHLLRAGETVVLAWQSVITLGPGGLVRLDGFSSAGEPVIGSLALPSSTAVFPGPDALVVSPEPGLVSDHLEVLAPLPPPVPTGFFDVPALDWSLAEGQLTAAFVDGGSVFTQRFDTTGAPMKPAGRVSSAVQVDAVGRAAGGDGLVFEDVPGPEAEPASSTWFAFADGAGVKRGPDVPLPVPFTPRADVLVASPVEDAFGLFTRGSGRLVLTRVRCE
jgi:hypothetical protein